MKLIWFSHDKNLSGANLCLLEYADVLKAKGFKIAVIVPGKGQMDDACRLRNFITTIVPFYSWVAPPASRPRSLVFRMKRMIRNKIALVQILTFARHIKPDFIITNTISSQLAAMAAKKTGTRHVWFVHEFGEEDHGFSIEGGFKRAASWMEEHSYKIAFNSKAVRLKYHSIVSNAKSVVVANIVTVPKEPLTEVPPHPFKLILLGQVAASKNHIEALKALKICIRKGLDVYLDITGKAEDESYVAFLQSFARENNMAERVVLTGILSPPFRFLKEHHALIMCSRYEAFGRVTVEALKCGVPVVAANSGGSSEIISDGINGYLYEAGDEEQLATRIMQLHHNYQSFNKKVISESAFNRYNEMESFNQLMQVFS